MGIPIKTVVELLMENATRGESGQHQVMLDGCWHDSFKVDDVRGYIRDYLQSLVPVPKLLSECEEGVPYVVRDNQGWMSVLCNEDGGVAVCHVDGSTQKSLSGRSDIYTAIQPVEVNRE